MSHQFDGTSSGMRRVQRRRRSATAIACLCASLVHGTGAWAQDTTRPDNELRTIDAPGARFEYAEFAREGSPVILIPGTHLNASAMADLGRLLSGGNRVLALTPRPLGQSLDVQENVPVQARSFLAFMDALDIDRAVLVSNIADELTWLAEHHPERLAGLVHLGGPPREPELEWANAVPEHAFEMFVRAVAPPGSPNTAWASRPSYRPRYLETDAPTMPVPTLLLEGRAGMRGVERLALPLLLAGSPLTAHLVEEMPAEQGRDHFRRLWADVEYRNRNIAAIADPQARAFFARLAADEALQGEVWAFWQETAVPAQALNWERFRRAFGPSVRTVRIDVPVLSGYEYRDLPDLISPHIRRFLEELGSWK